MSEFRSAQASPTPSQPTKQGDTSSATNTSESSLFATYNDDTGKPYTADYMEIGEVWDSQVDLKSEVETIEGYVRDKVSKKEVDNTTKSAKKYLQELEKKAGSNPYDAPNRRIEKLLAYIEFRKVVES